MSFLHDILRVCKNNGALFSCQAENNSPLLVFYNHALYNFGVDREPIDKIFHAALKAYCHGKRGIQAFLANKSGVPQPQLSAIQTGKAAGSEETRRMIAEAADMEYEEFLDIGRRQLNITNRYQAREIDTSVRSQNDKTTKLLKLAERILSGQDDSLALALEQNIIAFAESLDKNDRITQQKKDIQEMQRHLDKSTIEDCPVPSSSPEKTGT